MKNEPPKTFKMTAKEAQNKIVEYSQKSNQYAFRENEVMEQKVEASKIALRRAMKTPDENGMITFSEPDWEYRQRQKRAAEKKMKALGDLADQYVDAQEKNMPEGADEPFKERTPHEKNIIDAMTLAKSVGQTAETGFQRPEEYHFTGSKMASKDGEDYAELSRKMDGFVMWLEEAETDVYFGSKEYDNMKKYATYMRDELDRMAKAPIPDNAQDAEVQRDVQFNRAQGMMNTMRALSGMYLKRRDLKNDQSNIKTRKRMLAATTLYAFAKNNCDRFDVEAQYDLYRDGLAQERENAFANMKPKQIGTYIKNTIRMANAHKDDPLFVNTAQTELSKYMRLVKNQTAQEVGLSKNDVRDLNKFNKEHPIAPPKDTKEKTMEQTELDGTEMKETNPEFKEDGNSRHSSRTPSISITG